MNSLEAQILTPEGSLFDGEVSGVRLPGTQGSFEVKPMHAPIISTLQPGKIIVRKTDGTNVEYAVSGGLVEVHDNLLNLLAEAAEPIDDIDTERAQQAKERAEKRLEKAAEDDSIDQQRARKAKSRALNRLKLADLTMTTQAQD